MAAGTVRKPGVCYAMADGGIELPVVDITNPAFDIEVAPDALPALVESSQAAMERWMRNPALLRRAMAAFLVRNSVLMGGSTGSSEYMTGMVTYLNKLGPDNLDPRLTRRMDRKVAGMISSVAVRYRLRAVAELLADHLATCLAGDSRRKVHLVNIAGGPASDTLNALILVQRKRPELLAGRDVSIVILDLEESGARFAASSLSALLAPGAPLDGVSARVEYVRYDWSDPSVLEAALNQRGADGILAGSSEGGMFEYAAEADIAANLRVLHAASAEGFEMVGTSWRDEPLTRAMQAMSPLTFHLREMDVLGPALTDSGWAVDRLGDDNPVYHVFRLRKAALGHYPH